MVNRTGKGNRRELEARRSLEKAGYLVEKKNSSRWESNDFWGVFDVLALKPDGSEVKLVQVKSNVSDFYKARRVVQEWADKNEVSGISCEVWCKENYQEWRKERVLGRSCEVHDMAFADKDCSEACNYKVLECPMCGYFVKE